MLSHHFAAPASRWPAPSSCPAHAPELPAACGGEWSPHRPAGDAKVHVLQRMTVFTWRCCPTYAVMLPTCLRKRLLPRSTTRTWGRAEGERRHFLQLLFSAVQTEKKNPWHLFYGQLFESRQRAGEEADYKGGGGADDVQHGGRQHGDVRVLPGEGVEEGHHCMTTLRQRAAGREKEIKQVVEFGYQ